MTKKTKTIKVGGGADYAKVADRIKMFREDCPQGSIKTTPTFMDDQIMFTTEVIKDLSNEYSARATGNAMGTNKGVKAFEKIESISVGRALAMLGYMADGEIATSEEMEEFNDYKKTKNDELVIQLVEKVNEITSIEELKALYLEHKGCGKEFDAAVINRKKELNENL